MFLKIDNVTKMYDKENGVKNIKIDVEHGELLSILGPSGCGKTTILNIIAGFLNVDSGKLILDSKDITGLPPEKREISTVFQNFALFPHMNVNENISYGLKYKKLSKEEIKNTVDKFIKMVGLENYKNSSVTKLSGGQQQRVALARSMAINPKVLLLDEPFSSLDAKLRIKMREELKILQRKFGITMVFVTHDREEALSISEKIIIMNKGEIVQIGTPEEIYSSPSNDYVANFIGEVNVIKFAEGKKFVRPENLKIEKKEKGSWEVVSKLFMGAYTIFIIKSNENIYKVQMMSDEAKLILIGDKVTLIYNQ